MQVAIAYSFVVLIWATTPLAIKWSNTGLGFVEAVAARMLLALLVCSLIMLALRRPLLQRRSDWKVFVAGAIGLFPNMLLVYWSAQFIPSGLMAVVLGVYPFIVGLLSLLVLKEQVFTAARIVALILAVLGLGVIHFEQLALGGDSIYGIVGMLGSACLFAVSSVWLKAIGSQVDPLRQSTGILALTAPGLLLVWWLFDGALPEVVALKAALGIGYLSIAGTVVGGTLFFYVLRNCTMSSVSLITLMTPMMALTIGNLVEGETVSATEFAGCLLILFSLAVYQGALRTLSAQLRRLLRPAKSADSALPATPPRSEVGDY